MGIVNRINLGIKRHALASARKKVQSEIKRAMGEISEVEKEMSLIAPGSEVKPDDASYFRVLGIKPTKDKALIKQAYRSKAMQYHPDVKKINNSEEMMKKLNMAYLTLSKGGGGADAPASEGMRAMEIEKRFISIYMKLRESDYSAFIWAARSSGSRNEVVGLAHSVTNWKERADRAERLLKGRLDSRINALEKRSKKIKRLMREEHAEDPLYIHAKQAISEIADCLDESKAFQHAARKAIDSANARIMPLEEEQKKRLFSSLY